MKKMEKPIDAPIPKGNVGKYEFDDLYDPYTHVRRFVITNTRLGQISINPNGNPENDGKYFCAVKINNVGTIQGEYPVDISRLNNELYIDTLFMDFRNLIPNPLTQPEHHR